MSRAVHQSSPVVTTASRREVLRQRARGMRLAPTESEAVLWRHLMGRALGVAFRRQVVLRGCIVDFYASEVRLVVEVEGPYHERRLRLDARRTLRLERAGCRVLRLSEELVLRQTSVAVARVRETVQGLVPRCA